MYISQDHNLSTKVSSYTKHGALCISVCVLLCEQAIKLVRTGELKPFVVYCRAPSFEEMKEMWVLSGHIRVSATCIDNTTRHT